jgi:hypothetical protein
MKKNEYSRDCDLFACWPVINRMSSTVKQNNAADYSANVPNTFIQTPTQHARMTE